MPTKPFETQTEMGLELTGIGPKRHRDGELLGFVEVGRFFYGQFSLQVGHSQKTCLIV